MAKIILMTGTIVGYAYIMEFFIAWYGGNMYEESGRSYVQPRGGSGDRCRARSCIRRFSVTAMRFPVCRMLLTGGHTTA